ncbi:MAG: phosphatidate cytidylyltransferase [Actinomycetota bacterium]
MVRVVTGVVLGGAVLGLLALGRAPFFLLVLAVVLVAQAELYHALRQAEYDPATSLGLVAGAVLLGGTYLRGGAAVGLVLFLTLVFSFVWYAGAGREASGPTAEAEPVPLGRSATAGIAVTMLGVAYVPLLAAFAVLLLTRPDGVGLVLTLVGGVAVYDTVAYFAGRAFGRRRLAPSISPGKAIEGTIGATVGTVLVMAFVAPRLGPWDMVQAALLGTAICVMAPLGDLFESLLKRDLGIKDTGMLLPGHGGALDRIDAILFCAPAVYASLRVFGL